MAKTASIDVGCGVYSYAITAPEKTEDPPQDPPPDEPKKTDLVLGERECFPDGAFDGKTVDDDFFPQYIGWACAGSALPESNIKKGDKDSFRHWATVTNGIPYTFNAYWEDGCETSVDEVNLFAPLPDSNEDQLNCMTIFEEDYNKCEFGPPIPFCVFIRKLLHLIGENHSPFT